MVTRGYASINRVLCLPVGLQRLQCIPHSRQLIYYVGQTSASAGYNRVKVLASDVKLIIYDAALALCRSLSYTAASDELKTLFRTRICRHLQSRLLRRLN
jgi:hypothetical protein